MKKVFIVALLAIFIGTTAFEKSVNTAGYEAHNEFNKLFNDSKNVVEVSTDDFAKFIFAIKGEKQKAFYSKEGKYLGTIQTFAFDKLPEKALTTILKKYSYPKYELKECVEYKNTHSDMNYYVSFQKKKKKIILKVSPLGLVTIFDRA